MKTIRKMGRALMRMFYRPLDSNNHPLICCGDLPRPIRRRLAIRDAVDSRKRYHRKSERLGLA
jgi:hypothetical protein